MRKVRRASTVSLVREEFHRVEIRIDCTEGELRVEYKATAAEASHFAAAMIKRGFRVLVDQKVRRGLRPLPCRNLWRYA
ncbi:hypothetical protein [Nocardia africana]